MKKFILVLIALVLFSVPAFSQFAVLDVFSLASFTQLITQVYATYDNIMATIETVKNTYQQLEKTVKNLQNINFDDITDLSRFDGKDAHGVFLEFRSYYKDSLSAINRNMNLLNDVQDAFTNRSVSFAGQNYSMAGLMGAGGGRYGASLFDLPVTAAQYAKDSLESAAAGYAGKLSYEDEKRLMNQWGLSPRNYFKVKAVENISQDIFDTLLAKGTKEGTEKIIEEMINNQKGIDEAMEIASDSESAIAQNKVINMALGNLNNSITQLNTDFSRFTSYYAHEIFKKKTEEEIEAEKREKIINSKEKEADFIHSQIERDWW